MTPSIRFAYMTNDLKNLGLARELAGSEGFAVDMLPPDAPLPEPGAYDGVMVDFAPSGRHAFERETFLKKLVGVAKVFPVVAYDRGGDYREAATMRAAGIKRLPTLRANAFDAMLAHPLAAKVAAAKMSRAAVTAEVEMELVLE